MFLAMTGVVFLQMAEGFAGSYAQLPVLLFKVIVYFWLPILTTVITMRLFAEEKRSGTLEALMTGPVTEIQVVLGKYLGALSFLVIATAPAVAYIYILAYFSPGVTHIDSGAVIGGSLFAFVLATFCTSIGLVASLTTRNQIIAAISCFSMVLLPFIAEFLVVFFPQVNELEMSHYISLFENLIDFTRGSIDTRPLIMYGSGTVFLLFLSVKIMELRKWK
jgi:ABC-2 type transport system permease protein